MPQIEFDALPDDARVWVFAADRALNQEQSANLLSAVDGFLRDWHAHGAPLRCARDWRDDRFLAIGVDQSTAGASGCSIDGLFRLFKAITPTLGASMLSGGTVFWRDPNGAVRSGTRKEFGAAAARGEVTDRTLVFDTTVATALGWREKFEAEASASWHSSLLGSVSRQHSGSTEPD